MTFRDDDDDTSPGSITQGGSTPRRGNSIFWALGAVVIILAIAIAVVTLPRKHSKAEEGTTPVSGTLNSTGSAGAVVAPSVPLSPAASPAR